MNKEVTVDLYIHGKSPDECIKMITKAKEEALSVGANAGSMRIWLGIDYDEAHVYLNYNRPATAGEIKVYETLQSNQKAYRKQRYLELKKEFEEEV